MKKIFTILILISFIGILSYSLYSKTYKNNGVIIKKINKNSSVLVSIEKIRKGEINDIKLFSGSLKPYSEFDVSSKINGLLKKVNFDVGDSIINGSTIAIIDPKEYHQQIIQEKANIEVAKASLGEVETNLEISKKELKRKKILFDKKFTSEEEVEKAKTNYKSVLAKIKTMKAQVNQRQTILELAELKLSYTNIKAEWVSGSYKRFISERFVDEGAILPNNGKIVSIIDINKLKTDLFITEKDYPLLKIGQTAKIIVDAYPNKLFSGKISRISPKIDNASRKGKVEVVIDNPKYILKSGMYINAEIELKKKNNVTLVPLKSIVKKYEGTDIETGLYLADLKNKKAKFVPVETGISDNDNVEIISPKIEGFVIISSQHLLKDLGNIKISTESKDKFQLNN